MAHFGAPGQARDGLPYPAPHFGCNLLKIRERPSSLRRPGREAPAAAGAIPRHCQCKYLNFTTIVAVPCVTRFYLYKPPEEKNTVKKLLTMVFALALMGSMSFAQSSSGDQSSSSGQTATSGQSSTSGDQSGTTTTTTKKHHAKRHKKSKGTSTDSTSNPSDSSGSTSNPK